MHEICKVPRPLRTFSSRCSPFWPHCSLEVVYTNTQAVEPLTCSGENPLLPDRVCQKLSLVTGRPKVQRACAAHIAVKACVKLYFTLFLSPGYSLLASTSVFHSFPCLLLWQSSVSRAHLRCPFQEIMKLKPPVCPFVMSRFRKREYQGKGLKHLSVWVGVWCCCNPSPLAAAGDKMFGLWRANRAWILNSLPRQFNLRPQKSISCALLVQMSTLVYHGLHHEIPWSSVCIACYDGGREVLCILSSSMFFYHSFYTFT